MTMSMKALSRWILAPVMVVAMVLMSAYPAMAQQNSASQRGDVIVNMRDVDIADVAQQISRITGRTIILDPSVQGTINVASATPLSSAGVWQLFVTVLRGQGYAVVRNGRAWRVVPQATAVREPSNGSAEGRVVTRLIRLRTLSPEAAARIFKPLVATFGSVEAVTNPNAIVVTDYADNVARIASLAGNLDRGGVAAEVPGFASISLGEGSAADVAAAIEAIMGGGEGGPRAVADERSNIVLVRGTRAEIAEARRIANTLDRPNGEPTIVRVIRLKYNDAETITQIVGGLIGGEGEANNPVARTLNSGTGTMGDNQLASGADFVRETTSAAGGLPTLGSSADFVANLRSQSNAANPVPTGFSSEDLAIQAAPELNAIVLRGTKSRVAMIETLVNDLDVRRPQVMIEAAIVEITGDQSEQLGIQLGLGGAADFPVNTGGTSFSNLGISLRQALGFVGAPAAALIGEGLGASVGSRGDFAILVQALGQSTKANLLSTPSVTTLDNRPAEIVVGQNVPFRTGSFVSQGITTTPFTTIERADVGITLRVIPRIHEGNTVRLEVNQEVSSLIGSVAGAADIITNRRSIQTTVLADDGQTIVLGGLISDDQMETRSQVPVLGDIPIIGELFKSRRNSKTRRTLFVFLKPTILRDPSAVADASAEKYGRVRAAEGALSIDRSLLLEPLQARLPVEINGIY